MPTMDVFTADAFSLRSLTAAVNKLPFKPSRIGELGLFAEKGIFTTTVQVEEKQGQLSLIPTSRRGAPADTIGRDARTMRNFSVPHLARESLILADEIQNVRAFGSDNALEAVQTVITDRLATLRAMHEVTLEYHRIGAIKGIILDSNGSSTIYNLFTEFGVSQQTENFAFSSATTDVNAVCIAALRKIESVLGGSPYTGARAFVSSGFYDSLVGHPLVKETYKYQQGQILRSDLRRGFVFGGITWEEYPGAVVDPGGTSRSFIAANEGVLFPEGAQTEQGPLFQTWFAPADFEETVNTMGLPLYVRQAVDPEFRRWTKLHSQSNPLCICLRPRACIKLTKS